MTTDATQAAAMAGAPADDTPPRRQEPAPERRRGFVAQVLFDTFANKRARFSAIWIGFLVFCAVLAPFLANSHPLLLKAEGHWSSPALRNLTATDVILLAITFVALGNLLLSRALIGERLKAAAWAVT